LLALGRVQVDADLGPVAALALEEVLGRHAVRAHGGGIDADRGGRSGHGELRKAAGVEGRYGNGGHRSPASWPERCGLTADSRLCAAGTACCHHIRSPITCAIPRWPSPCSCPCCWAWPSPLRRPRTTCACPTSAHRPASCSRPRARSSTGRGCCASCATTATRSREGRA